MTRVVYVIIITCGIIQLQALVFWEIHRTFNSWWKDRLNLYHNIAVERWEIHFLIILMKHLHFDQGSAANISTRTKGTLKINQERESRTSHKAQWISEPVHNDHIRAPNTWNVSSGILSECPDVHGLRAFYKKRARNNVNFTYRGPKSGSRCAFSHDSVADFGPGRPALLKRRRSPTWLVRHPTALTLRSFFADPDFSVNFFIFNMFTAWN